MADKKAKPKVETTEISADLTKAITKAITDGFKNATVAMASLSTDMAKAIKDGFKQSTSSFGDLSKDLSTALEQGFKLGTAKSKGYMDSTTLLEAMKDDLKEIADYEKEASFQAQIQAKAMDYANQGKSVSMREVEVELLNEQVQLRHREVTEVYNLNKALGMAALMQAKMKGDTEGALRIRRELLALGQAQTAAKKEAEETEKVNIELRNKLKIQRELDEAEKKRLAVIEKMKDVKDTLKAQLGITKALVDQFKTPEFAKAVFAEQMGERIHEASESFEEFHKQGLDAGQSVQAMFKGMNLESMMGLSDTKGVLNGMIQQYGSLNGLSKELVGDLGHMAHEMGITGEEAFQVNAALSQIPGETSESAANAMKMTGQLAKQQGIAPGKIMKDIAKNTEAMALFGGKGAKEFGKTAIELHKMGIEIGTAAKMANGLLDFENSINKQMEASVLLGREINFDKARELALAGDLAGAAKEVIAQAGGEAEWAKMNVLQKQKLAEAAGMTVEEMQKQIDAQKEHNKYFGEESSLMDNIIGSVLKYGGAAVGFMKQYGMMLISGIQLLANENAMKLLSNVYDKIKIALGLVYQGIMWAINGILNSRFLINIKDFAVEQGKKVLAIAMLGLTQARVALENLLNNTKMGMWVKEKAQWALEKAHFAWKKAQSALGIGGGAAAGAGKKLAGAGASKLTEGAGDKLAGAGGGKQTGGLTGAIEKIDAKKLLAGAAALVIVAAAVYVFAKAAQEFTSVPWSSIGKAIVSMLALVGALALIGAIMMSGVGALAILAGAAAMLIMAAALFVLGKAIQEIAKGFDMFIPALLQLAPMAGDLLALGASLIVLGAGMITLGVGALIAFPGMLLASIGLTALATGLFLVGTAGAVAMPAIQGLMALAAMAPLFAELALAISGMAIGLVAFATAGLFTLPTIFGLIALSLVAPILIALGKSIQFDLGGGSKVEGGDSGKESDKMDVLIGKVDQLIAVASKGGTINMDGKKVGDIVRLSINSAGVR